MWPFRVIVIEEEEDRTTTFVVQLERTPDDGSVVELGPTSLVARTPEHPYSLSLLASSLSLDPDVRRAVLERKPRPPTPCLAVNDQSGCGFAPYCGSADISCYEMRPRLLPGPRAGHQLACHHPVELS